MLSAASAKSLLPKRKHLLAAFGVLGLTTFVAPSSALAQEGAAGWGFFTDNWFTAAQGAVNLNDTFTINVQSVVLQEASGVFVPPFAPAPGVGIADITPFAITLRCNLASCATANGGITADAYAATSDIVFNFVGPTPPFNTPVAITFPAFSPGAGTIFDYAVSADGSTASLELDLDLEAGVTATGLSAYTPGTPDPLDLPVDILSFDSIDGQAFSNGIGLVSTSEEVPGPLPVLGLAAAFATSRKLRTRIKSAS